MRALIGEEVFMPLQVAKNAAVCGIRLLITVFKKVTTLPQGF
jgi:hypothetical protein